MKQFEQVRGKLIDMLEDLDVSLGEIAEDPQSIDSTKTSGKNSPARHTGSITSSKVVNSNSDQNLQNPSIFKCSLCGNSIDSAVLNEKSQKLICPDCKKIMQGH